MTAYFIESMSYLGGGLLVAFLAFTGARRLITRERR